MKVSVISRWHDAADFAPFFLSHYAWADEIIIMLDKWTIDNSAEIISQYPNARFEYFDHGGVINDRLLADMMSDLAGTLKSDWVIYVDADEFVFSIRMEDPKAIFVRAEGTVIQVQFRWVYRHISEMDLDSTKPAIWQRRHGGIYTIVPNVIGTAWECGHIKPSIVKPEAKIRWTVGQHYISSGRLIQYSKMEFDGVHWQMADVEIAVRRNASSKARLSAENINHGWGVKNFTEEMIRAECKTHENDPQIF